MRRKLIENEQKSMFLDTRNMDFVPLTDVSKNRRLKKMVKNEEVLFNDFILKSKKFKKMRLRDIDRSV